MKSFPPVVKNGRYAFCTSFPLSLLAKIESKVQDGHINGRLVGLLFACDIWGKPFFTTTPTKKSANTPKNIPAEKINNDTTVKIDFDLVFFT